MLSSMIDDSVRAGGRAAALLRRSPAWLRVVIGILLVLLGAVLLTRPTTSLGILALLIGAGFVVAGIAEAVDHDDGSRPPLLRIVVACAWVAAGVFVLVLPGLTIRIIAVVVGAGLILKGGATLVAGFARSSTADIRVSRWALGAAGILFGVVALAWPDITLLVVSVAFGGYLVVMGATTAWGALARPRTTVPRAPGRLRRWSTTIAACLALVVAIAAASVSVILRQGSPVVDDFYAAPRDVPDEPGQLIRAEAFSREVPADAQAWRILYTTTRGDGSAAVASALVVVPRVGAGDWPVIAWAHGTTGYAENCAPSLLTQPFESGALFLLPEIIAQGWALVATDYIGLGTQGPHPYLIGADSAHATLDAVRAARGLADARIGTETVAWGHSQGGGAALWTGALASSYAPDVELAGVAALAPASDLAGLVSRLATATGGSVLASFVLAAYTSIYPDVTYRDYVRPGAEATLRAMATRCLSEPGSLASVLSALGMADDPEFSTDDPASGALGRRFAENTPPATISAPLLVGQGGADAVVARSIQDAYVAGLCSQGQQVDYRVYAGRDHVPLVQPDSPLVPDLVAWTQERFAGAAAPTGCRTTER